MTSLFTTQSGNVYISAENPSYAKTVVIRITEYKMVSLLSR